jgi:hypothetical protein
MKITGICFDCDKVMDLEETEKGLDVKDGHFLVRKDTYRIKCNECFGKNPKWIDKQPCEVYSRVVGYIRPVQQWHASKQEEYRERKTFALKADTKTK